MDFTEQGARVIPGKHTPLINDDRACVCVVCVVCVGVYVCAYTADTRQLPGHHTQRLWQTLIHQLIFSVSVYIAAVRIESRCNYIQQYIDI